MKKKTSFWTKLLVTLILISICIILSLSLWIAYSLPTQTAKKFGPVNPELELTQKLYLSARLLWQEENLLKPGNINGEPKSFEIGLGETTNEITQRLYSEDFIHDTDAFRDYLVYSGLDTSIQAGQFSLNPRMNAMEIAHALQDSTPLQITFNILAGWRVEEIADALPTSGLNFSPGSFIQFTQKPTINHALLQHLPEGASLEGYFFPDSYRIDRNSTQEQFVSTILDNFLIKVTPTMLEGFEKQGLNLHQAVTLASIVQRESIIEEEMGTIASVFLNRLSLGMRLETDPTVQYALGYQDIAKTWWKNPLGLEDLQFESPYNTYIYPGLPPGPIANPGLLALSAVAQPEQTPYYFFRATCDGSGRHNFSQTFEEHKANACP